MVKISYGVRGGLLRVQDTRRLRARGIAAIMGSQLARNVGQL